MAADDGGMEVMRRKGKKRCGKEYYGAGQAAALAALAALAPAW
jgi:hypothetical protein